MNDDDVTFEASDRADDGRSEEDLEATESRVDSKLAKVKKELEATKKEKQEYLDGWQRAKADYVNALKRFDEDRAAAQQKGMMKAVEAFLPAMDSLARAEGAGEIPESFQAIAKQLHSAAQGLGMVQIGEVGETFDPTLHEALGQDVAASAAEDDTVTAILEKGWKAGERVVRPAKVRVAHFEG